MESGMIYRSRSPRKTGPAGNPAGGELDPEDGEGFPHPGARDVVAHLRIDRLLFLVVLVQEGELALQQERAGGDHAIARGEPGVHDLASARMAAELDGAQGEGQFVGAGGEED